MVAKETFLKNGDVSREALGILIALSDVSISVTHALSTEAIKVDFFVSKDILKFI